MAGQVLSRLEIPNIWWISNLAKMNRRNILSFVHACIYIRISIHLFAWQPLKSIHNSYCISWQQTYFSRKGTFWWRCKVSHLPWDIYPFPRVLTTLLDQPWISRFPSILPYQLSTLMNALSPSDWGQKNILAANDHSYFSENSIPESNGRGGLLWFIHQ